LLDDSIYIYDVRAKKRKGGEGGKKKKCLHQQNTDTDDVERRGKKGGGAKSFSLWRTITEREGGGRGGGGGGQLDLNRKRTGVSTLRMQRRKEGGKGSVTALKAPLKLLTRNERKRKKRN